MSKSKKRHNSEQGDRPTLREYQEFTSASYKVFQLDTVLQCARDKLNNWDGMLVKSDRERFYALFSLSRTLTEMVGNDLETYKKSRFDFSTPDGKS